MLLQLSELCQEEMHTLQTSNSIIGKEKIYICKEKIVFGLGYCNDDLHISCHICNHPSKLTYQTKEQRVR